MHKEKRRFHRISMDGLARLQCQSSHWSCRLIDISLKGALISKPADWAHQTPENCELEIELATGILIHMQGAIVHGTRNTLGFYCQHIDIDSISHLKRLVELNLGDQQQLERELTELGQ